MRFLAGLLAIFIGVPSAFAQSYPNRTIRIVVPFGAGGGADIATRIVANQVQKETGAGVFIENMPGALGLIGANAVRRAEPDGYTLVMSGPSTHSLASAFSKDDPKYDPLRDFTHVIRFATFPFVLAVNGSSRIESVKDLVRESQANPGKLSWGYSSGTGQLTGFTFNRHAGIKALDVPYKTTPQAVNDLLGGLIVYMPVELAVAAQFAKDNKLRLLVLLADQRSAILPQLPTLEEGGVPSIGLTGWAGIAGPAGMPAVARQWLASAFNVALSNPDVIDRLKKAGVEPGANLRIEEWVSTQLQIWARASKEAGLTSQ